MIADQDATRSRHRRLAFVLLPTVGLFFASAGLAVWATTLSALAVVGALALYDDREALMISILMGVSAVVAAAAFESALASLLDVFVLATLLFLLGSSCFWILSLYDGEVTPSYQSLLVVAAAIGASVPLCDHRNEWMSGLPGEHWIVFHATMCFFLLSREPQRVSATTWVVQVAVCLLTGPLWCLMGAECQANTSVLWTLSLLFVLVVSPWPVNQCGRVNRGLWSTVALAMVTVCAGAHLCAVYGYDSNIKIVSVLSVVFILAHLRSDLLPILVWSTALWSVLSATTTLSTFMAVSGPLAAAAILIWSVLPSRYSPLSTTAALCSVSEATLATVLLVRQHTSVNGGGDDATVWWVFGGVLGPLVVAMHVRRVLWSRPLPVRTTAQCVAVVVCSAFAVWSVRDTVVRVVLEQAGVAVHSVVQHAALCVAALCALLLPMRHTCFSASVSHSLSSVLRLIPAFLIASMLVSVLAHEEGPRVHGDHVHENDVSPLLPLGRLAGLIALAAPVLVALERTRSRLGTAVATIACLVLGAFLGMIVFEHGVPDERRDCPVTYVALVSSWAVGALVAFRIACERLAVPLRWTTAVLGVLSLLLHIAVSLVLVAFVGGNDTSESDIIDEHRGTAAVLLLAPLAFALTLVAIVLSLRRSGGRLRTRRWLVGLSLFMWVVVVAVGAPAHDLTGMRSAVLVTPLLLLWPNDGAIRFERGSRVPGSVSLRHSVTPVSWTVFLLLCGGVLAESGHETIAARVCDAVLVVLVGAAVVVFSQGRTTVSAGGTGRSVGGGGGREHERRQHDPRYVMLPYIACVAVPLQRLWSASPLVPTSLEVRCVWCMLLVWSSVDKMCLPLC